MNITGLRQDFFKAYQNFHKETCTVKMKLMASLACIRYRLGKLYNFYVWKVEIMIISDPDPTPPRSLGSDRNRIHNIAVFIVQ